MQDSETQQSGMTEARPNKPAEEEKKPSFFKRRREECFDGPVWLPRKSAHNWFIYVAAYLVRPFFKLLFRYRAHGLENFDMDEGPYIFACNHVSFADPIILWFILYRKGIGGSRFLARSSLFRPLIGGAMARAGAIPIDPDTADTRAVKRAARCLKRGENMLIFPEGTRMNTPEKTYHPHAGVVLIARMGKAKIVPVGISGTEKIMPYGKPKFIRFPRVDVNFGVPIDVKSPRYADIPKHDRPDAITRDVMDECFRLRDTARDETER